MRATLEQLSDRLCRADFARIKDTPNEWLVGIDDEAITVNVGEQTILLPFKPLGLTRISAAERMHIFLLADGETRAREQAGAGDLPTTVAYRALRDRFKQEQP